jgi:hypothetical protein
MFFEKSVGKSQIPLNLTRITGTLIEDHCVSLRSPENEKSDRKELRKKKSEHTVYALNLFSEKSYRL